MNRVIILLLFLSFGAQAQPLISSYDHVSVSQKHVFISPLTGIMDTNRAHKYNLSTQWYADSIVNALGLTKVDSIKKSNDTFYYYKGGTRYFAGLDVSASGAGSGTVTDFSAGDLSPLFTTSESNTTTTPALSFSLSSAAAHKFFGNNTGSTGAPGYVSIGTGDLPTGIDAANINTGDVSNTEFNYLDGVTSGIQGQIDGKQAAGSYVTQSTTVNGHPLSSNITVTAGDLGATTVGNNLFTLTNPTAIRFIKINADNTVTTEDAATFRTSIGAGTGNGSVTSVALTLPSWLSVSGSPVTSSGTLAVSAATGQTQNQFLATPNGSTGAVGLRSIVAADIPTLNQNTTGSAATLTTPRNINGVAFNGSADITVAAAAGTLTGTTLNSTVTGSSLTSHGTITSGGLGTGAMIGGVTMTLGSDATGDLYYRNASGVLTRFAAGATGTLLQMGTSSVPRYTTATYPQTAGTSGKILISDGTNIVSSTPTYPNASATSGKIIKSDGTNFVASTETYAAPGTSGNVMLSNGTDWTSGKIPEALIVAVSDESTAITTGTAKVTFRMPYAMTLTSVRASVNTASSSGLPTINVKESGTTIFSTKVTIDANEKTSQTAATPSVLSDTSLADDAEMTVDIDVAGTGAKGLKIILIGTR